jgi:hypothetical protein
MITNMPARPLPHLPFVRFALAMVLLGLAIPRSVMGLGHLATGVGAALSQGDYGPSGYLDRVLVASRHAAGESYWNWCAWYVPSLAAGGMAIYLFRRRTPAWLRRSLGAPA